LAWFYPFVLLFVGYLVAVLVLAPVVRQLNGEGVNWPVWVVSAAEWLVTGWWIPPVMALVLFVLLATVLWPRAKYSRPIRRALFCSALADQVVHDIPESEAVKLAADFSGDSTLRALQQPAFLAPAVVRVVDGGGDWQQIVDQSDKVSMVAALRYRARYYEERARRREYLWVRTLPRTLMVVVGAGLALSYVWWVIAPVYRQVATW
jgi:hypothetical protein